MDYYAALDHIKMDLHGNHYKHERMERANGSPAEVSSSCGQRGLLQYSKNVQEHDHECQLRVELQRLLFDAWKHGAEYVDAKGNAHPNKKTTTTLWRIYSFADKLGNVVYFLVNR